MYESRAQKTAATQPLSVEAKVYPSKKEGNLLAFASVTLGGCFAVNNIRILNSENGMFLAMPDRQDGKGEYRDVCFPTTAEMRTALKTAVLNEYQKVMELMAERGAQARISVRDALKSPAQPSAGKAVPEAAKSPRQLRQRKAEKGAR